MLETTKSYFHYRMEQLGISEIQNSIDIWQYDSKKKQNELTPNKIFQEIDEGIKIIVYSLDRDLISYSNSK